MPRLRQDSIRPADVSEVDCGCGRPVYAIRDGDPVCVDCWIGQESVAAYDRVFYDRGGR